MGVLPRYRPSIKAQNDSRNRLKFMFRAWVTTKKIKSIFELNLRKKKTTMKQILVILITLLNLALSFSQSNDKLNESQKLEIYRKTFWDSLPKPLSWTNDYENLYTDKEEDMLDSIIFDFKNKTSVQIVIVTLDTIYTSKDKFDDITLHIANTWGVGEKIKNNGILIGISKGHRKIRIQNGYGIEKIITDLQTKEIIDNYFIPNFKKNEYFVGTYSGLNELINLLSNSKALEKK